MKYWWLEKYKDFKIIQIPELTQDVNYFLTMPKNYEKQYQILKNSNIEDLEEEELLVLLYKIVNTKNIKDNKLINIINKLLTYQDNSFPPSDYSLKEMLDEIKNLKQNIPDTSKLDNNNIAICYNCLNVFYVDKIKSVNKKNHCLCPFCLKDKIYFDNDYIPMNYTFIKLASMYYKTSNLGCTFKEIKKILKKNIKISLGENSKENINLTEEFPNKIKPIDEKIISKKIYDILYKKELDLNYETTIYIENLNNKKELKLLILLNSIIEILSNCLYLKKMNIILTKEEDLVYLNKLLKTLITF